MTRSTLLKMTFHSKTLKTVTDVNIICPVEYIDGKDVGIVRKNREYKVLWLFHGGTDDYSAWINRTMLLSYAEEYPELLIVMPTIYDFHSMLKKENYWMYAIEELPEMVQSTFPVSEKRQDNYIAGLSMGGYFAYRIAMTYPSRYACVGSFASPLDIEEDMRARHMEATNYPSPEEVSHNPDRDLFAMINDNMNRKAEMPQMFQACGMQDMTYNLNQNMRAYLEQKNIKHTYLEWPGSHNWTFWNTAIDKFLRWLPLKEEE